MLVAGYTPLHMACGYMQTGAMSALLESGADPLIKDKQGRDVVLLVDNLRKSMPPSVGALQRIMALEQVASGLTDRWEDASSWHAEPHVSGWLNGITEHGSESLLALLTGARGDLIVRPL